MERGLRRNYNAPGHVHELTFSCYRRMPLLEFEPICGWLAQSINEAKRQLRFHVWAFVFMPEHVHLLICPQQPEYDIARIRSAMKSPPARRAINYLQVHQREWLPRLERRRGPRVERLFWQSGAGYDRNIVEPKTLLATIEYIHLNPVRRGLVTRATDWRWSSAATFVHGAASPVQLDTIPSWWLDA